jgi:hypothetical protein
MTGVSCSDYLLPSQRQRFLRYLQVACLTALRRCYQFQDVVERSFYHFQELKDNKINSEASCVHGECMSVGLCFGVLSLCTRLLALCSS